MVLEGFGPSNSGHQKFLNFPKIKLSRERAPGGCRAPYGYMGCVAWCPCAPPPELAVLSLHPVLKGVETPALKGLPGLFTPFTPPGC